MMSKKYKKMQGNNDISENDGGEADAATIPAAPSSAPLPSSAIHASTDDLSGIMISSGPLAPSSASTSTSTLKSSKQPASQAVADETSLSQHLMNSLRIDHPLFRQRGQQPSAGDNAGKDDQGRSGDASNNGNGGGQQPQQQWSQPSLPSHPFGFGGGNSNNRGGGGGGANNNGGSAGLSASSLQVGAVARSRSGPMASFPFLSQPPQQRQQPAKDDQRAKSPPGFGGGSNNKGMTSVVPLTRTISTPESNYRPLKEDYPLLLQRSASSAFGSPSSFGKLKHNATKRSHSNSGNSDPGASAFHPVWSCKSLSTSSAGSVHSGSEQGSAVGSGASSSFAARSAHSDPLGGSERVRSWGRKNSSPWRLGQKVMARMKKSGRGGDASGSGTGGSGSGSGGKNSFKRTLSGRENPARPDLSADEGSPVNEIRVVPTIHSGDELGLGLRLSFGEGIGDFDTNNADDCRAGSSGGSDSSASKKASNVTKSGSGASKSKGKGQSSKRKQSKSAKSAKEDAQDQGSDKDGTKNNPLKSNPQQQYADPGVALDISSDEDDDDDDDIGPIVGNYIPFDDDDKHRSHSWSNSHHVLRSKQQQQNPRPPSIELPHPPSMEEPCEEHTSVEVISTSVTPTFHRPSSRAEGTTIMEETAFGSIHIFSPQTAMASSIEENSPPMLERVTIEEVESDAFPYHPLGEEGHYDEVSSSERTAIAGAVPLRLKYRSPQRAQPVTSGIHHRSSSSSDSHQHSPSSGSHDSPDLRLSLNGGSPASRISSSNSRATASTLNSGGDRSINTLQTEGSLVVDVMDNEVRDANRRSVRGSRMGSSAAVVDTIIQEMAGSGPDGNDTVFSSSTTSSNYHAYLSSPRPLRDGATMPVERFFAGGNVTMSPSPSRVVYPADHYGQHHGTLTNSMVDGAPTISKFIALSPKKLSRIGGGFGISGSSMSRDATHSPHTVSSNSISNNSSSSGETTKKPLKFVAYEIREETESPFDEPPASSSAGVAGRDSSSGNNKNSSSLIKPRISKIGGGNSQRHRPPMVQRASYKPPQSPRKQDAAYAARLSGARTPTRTPPPSSYKDVPSSGANTPCSPPVIVDGPTNVLCGDLSMKPTRPSVVRRSSAQVGGGRGMFLIPPSSSSSYRPHHPLIPPQPSAAAVASMNSPPQDNMTVVGGGTNDGAHEIVFASTPVPNMTTEGTGVSSSTLISPERVSLNQRNFFKVKQPVVNIVPKPKLKDDKHACDDKQRSDVIAVVSPEKGF